MARSLPLPARLAGAVWGHLIGDAMGVPYEFEPPERIGKVTWGKVGTYGKAPGTWSDDGALMLALLDSLVSVGFDTEDQGQRALAWSESGAYTPDGDVFDIGNATREALGRINSGVPAVEAGANGERSQSNGSLMRILPLALWAHGQSLPAGEMIELAFRASRVTHRQPVCQVVCAVYACLVRTALDGTRPDYHEDGYNPVRGVLKAPGGAEAEGLIQSLDELHEWRDDHRPAGRGGALDAFWSAWTAFEQATNYRETIELAIRYGHDTDTTAAIAGGLAGAWWGIDNIPAEWLTGMRGRDVVAPLVDGLLGSHGWRTSTSHPIRVDWVDLTQVDGLRDAPGRLGMTFLPGKQYDSTWSGPWWRDLDRDVARLRSEFGTDLLLLLVEDHELELTRTTRIADVIRANDIELVRNPIVDMHVPADPIAYRTTLDRLRAEIASGRTVVVACRGGLGRTGTAVACLLVDAGMDPEHAILLTRASRKNTIERGSQLALVRSWAREPGGVVERRMD